MRYARRAYHSARYACLNAFICSGGLRDWLFTFVAFVYASDFDDSAALKGMFIESLRISQRKFMSLRLRQPMHNAHVTKLVMKSINGSS